MQAGGLSDNDRVTELLLRSKHPEGDSNIRVPYLRADVLNLTPEQVEAQVMKMNIHSAGGPTQIRIFHLKIALKEDPSFKRHLTALINLLFRGRCPEDLRPLIAGARLVALEK